MSGSTASCRVALVSMHTSPAAVPGAGDAGGMNVYLDALAGRLVGEGFAVDLLTRRTDPQQPEVEVLTSGARLVHLDAGPADEVAKSDLANHLAEFAAAIAELGCYDVVHSHYWLSGIAGLAVARACGAPHVLSLHTVAAMKNATLPAGDDPEPERRIRWERELVLQSALTIAATATEAQAIRQFYHADPQRVAVVTPGVDRDLFTPGGRPPGWLPEPLRVAAENRGYLLVAARIQPLKGQDVAISALAALDSADRPLLVLAGGTSPGYEDFRTELDALVESNGLNSEVWFLPAQSRPRLAELMRGAALLLAPSRSETFGLVTLEAAASGVPSVVPAATGLADAVRGGVSGVQVAGFEAESWATAIRRLLENPETLAALQVSARQYSAGFSWDKVARELGNHYRALAASGQQDSPCSG
ncbi:MAG: glycosyltransferase [Actinomycetota bacterium]|nr:glycosyltransferase [Actinomycetota bacterium]